MRMLILDDDKVRHIQFNQKYNKQGNVLCHVETVEACIQKLQEETWDVVCLDHDLGGKTYIKSGKGTGFEVAEWLANNPDKKPYQIVIHSYNPAGRKNMMDVLPEAIEAPGIWLTHNS